MNGARSTTSGTDAPAVLLVSVAEAARLLAVCPNTVANLIARRELVSVKIGARRLIDVTDLRQLVESRKGVGQ